MVTKKVTKKRKTTDRKYVTKYSKKTPRAVICYCPQIMPDVMRVQLPYVTLQTYSGGGSVDILDKVYRGGSIFDPEFAVGGGQPLGHDEWQSLYQQYRVRAVTVELEVISDSATCAGFGCVPLNTSSALLLREQILEQNNYKECLLGIDTNKGMGKLRHYQTTAQQFGMPTDIVQYDDNFRASFGANPNSEYYWHIYAYGFGTASTSFEVQVRIRIIYHVDLFNRATLVRS